MALFPRFLTSRTYLKINGVARGFPAVRTEVLEAEPMHASARLKDEGQPAGDSRRSQALSIFFHGGFF